MKMLPLTFSCGAIAPTIRNEIEVFCLDHLHEMTAQACDELLANEMQCTAANVLNVCDP